MPPPAKTGLWQATITRVVGNAVYLKIPRLTANQIEFGPCLIIEGIWTKDILTHTTELSTAGDHGGHFDSDTHLGGHTHSPNPHDHKIPAEGRDLKVNDAVIVGFLEGNSSIPIVLGRLTK